MRGARSSPSFLAVARSGDTVYVQGHGQCSASLCPAFRDLVIEFREEGYRRFVVDLDEVSGMDSTFMGVLLGIQRILSECDGGDLVVANPSSHCHKQMEVVGLTRFLEVMPERVSFPQFEMTVLVDQDISDQEHIQMVKEAHERLVEVDKRNELKFGALLSALDRELEE